MTESRPSSAPSWVARVMRGSTATRLMAVAIVGLVVAGVAYSGVRLLASPIPVPGFEKQACSIPRSWLKRTQRGYFQPRSGQISLLPRHPAYMASGGGGWSHSGPWPYLQDVPLVFYGPGLIASPRRVERPVTLADVAPTYGRLMGQRFDSDDGRPLLEVLPDGSRTEPKLVVTIVWDGGGWNVLRRFPDSWPNLRRIMRRGVSFMGATDGSSPSVTPSVHTTLGTGVFPWLHGITGVPVRDENGEVVDSFLQGESSRFIEAPAFTELWDEAHGNRALVGMVGYEPWHLGMIGRGAERPAGDKDDAVWLDIETNEWITNDDYYRLPPSVPETGGLQEDLVRLDGEDGEVDGAWGEHAILEDPGRVEETPAFIRYHGRVLENLISDEGYGRDATTDLLFTNFKQIDRVGHYYNMASSEVRQSLEETDEVLGNLVDFLDEEVGRGNYVLTVTADHGQQPDAAAIDAIGIQPNEVESDMSEEFGPIVHAVWPTEVFLRPEEMSERGVTVAEVSRWLYRYTVRDNTQRPDILIGGAGRFDPGDRVFAMAIPARLLPELRCPVAEGT